MLGEGGIQVAVCMAGGASAGKSAEAILVDACCSYNYIVAMKTSFKLICGVLLGFLVMAGGCVGPWAGKQRAVKYYASAIALQEAEFEEDAIVQLREAVRLDTDFNLAHSLLGDLYRKRGNYEQAAVAYENACRIDPWAFSDHLKLGEVYKALERFSDAISVLRRACQLAPDSAEANYTLGTCYYETKNYELAAAFCSRAADLDPDNETILAGLGDIYGHTGDDYHAIKAYKQALEINPNHYDVMIRLGMVYLRMERYAPAQFILEKAIAAAPRQTEPHIALGYCLLCQHQLQAARNQYGQALVLDPGSFAAQNGIGVACMIEYLDDPDRNFDLCVAAVEAWHASLELNPDQPKIRRLVAKYLHLLRDDLSVAPAGAGSAESEVEEVPATAGEASSQ